MLGVLAPYRSSASSPPKVFCQLFPHYSWSVRHTGNDPFWPLTLKKQTNYHAAGNATILLLHLTAADDHEMVLLKIEFYHSTED